jgi:hypothetical protein
MCCLIRNAYVYWMFLKRLVYCRALKISISARAVSVLRATAFGYVIKRCCGKVQEISRAHTLEEAALSSANQE